MSQGTEYTPAEIEAIKADAFQSGQKSVSKQGTNAQTKAREKNTESFKTAADCIGKIEKGAAVFAVTRGQFSMIDAIMHCIKEIGPCNISVWTWTIAEYEVKSIERLINSGDLLSASLLIDKGAIKKNENIVARWVNRFGAKSCKYIKTHAKIARVWNDDYKILLRGSMNLNFNPRFEQFDLTEGCGGFDLVGEIEEEIPVLPITASNGEILAASKMKEAWETENLKLFEPKKVWAK